MENTNINVVAAEEKNIKNEFNELSHEKQENNTIASETFMTKLTKTFAKYLNSLKIAAKSTWKAIKKLFKKPKKEVIIEEEVKKEVDVR